MLKTHLKIITCAAVACALPLFGTSVASADSDKASSPSSEDGGPVVLTTIFNANGKAAAKNYVLAYRKNSNQLELLKLNGKKLVSVATTTAKANVWSAMAYPYKGKLNIAVAYGYGRGALGAPVELVLYDAKLNNPRTVYQVKSPRGQVTDLRVVGDSLAITHFDSKYFTQTSLISPNKQGGYSLKKLFRTRLGTSIEKAGDLWIVGRPYRDDEKDLDELLLYDGAEWTELPSHKGISSVALYGRPQKQPALLIGDGWDKNYGKLAEPRLSMVTYDRKKKAYSVEQIGTSAPQIRIEKIVVVSPTLVLTAGEKFVDAFRLKRGKWLQERLYEKTSSDRMTNVDFAYLGQRGGRAIVAVYGGQLKLLSVKR